MKKIIAALGALTMSFGIGAAQQMVSNPGGIVPSMAYSDIAPVLQEAGFETRVENLNGQSVLIASGLVQGFQTTLLMNQTACASATKCAGLWMFAFVNDSQSLETVNVFNQQYKPARASVVNGKVALDRYLIADYGTTRGSLAVNVSVMASSIRKWFEFSSQNGAYAVSFEPLIDDNNNLSALEEQDHEAAALMRALADNAALYNIDPSSDEGRLN